MIRKCERCTFKDEGSKELTNFTRQHQNLQVMRLSTKKWKQQQKYNLVFLPIEKTIEDITPKITTWKKKIISHWKHLNHKWNFKATETKVESNHKAMKTFNHKVSKRKSNAMKPCRGIFKKSNNGNNKKDKFNWLNLWMTIISWFAVCSLHLLLTKQQNLAQQMPQTIKAKH